MAEDGMLLNFSLDDSVIKPQQRFKGGTWKDRLVAKKIAVKRQNKSRHSPETGAVNSNNPQNPNKINVPTGQRPTKRQRIDGGDFKPTTKSSAGGGGVGNDEQTDRKSYGDRQVISSLFTYNPTAKTVTSTDGATHDEDTTEPAKPSNAPLIDGIDTFTSLGLSPSLATHLLTKLNLKTPTAIQKSSITQLLKEECDAFVQAQTGSGKTLAYLLPIVERLMRISSHNKGKKDSEGNTVHRDSGLFAIVLAPTRELCKQISVVLDGLLRCAHWIVAGTVIGGEKKKSEKARLRKGLNILVATPGRLADHLENTKVLDVSNVRWLVLDEGDRLMDLGFEEEIQGIIKKLDERRRPSKTPDLPAKRTTILCSATLKMNVQRLGEISLKEAIHIKADPADEDDEQKDGSKQPEFSAPAQLKQSYAVVAAKLRLVTLTALLKRTFARKGSVMKAIIFVSCADSVDFHFEVFTRRESSEELPDADDQNAPSSSNVHGTIATASAFSNPSNNVILHKLHGSLPQHVRTATLSAFAKQKDASVLICTDVAARGLDLPNVDFVIEYDPAFCSDDHLHRIGRTARLGRDGRALIFLLPGNEEGYVDILRGSYREGSSNSVTRNEVNEILKRGFGGNSEAVSKGWEDKATDWQLDIERWALEDSTILEMARRAYQSHIRAYATHIAAERHMFNIKDLHLGHLAKSFALRDRPAKINVPGLRPGNEDTKKSFKADRKLASGERRKMSAREDISTTDAAEARKKMQQKLKEHMAGASEFNIA
ncbi:ATP-dependent RNA helicase dbp7 [Coccidioides posadasii str. Silveira]|uniref:ATP-dependent RNA helicase n=1 Tax=Coccidioides posadasii (strain RMSCC 757 / Silveira) TaxID=443226 RepID=E9DHI5_COCPS|nr:ATP-dependent RNA helicase dbp7 [Coccidioides posadasii str. Silveira]QVM07735.1 ATP-dependent RNA helicase dbp7 [Coccidioides posadasii str. Silveira]